MDRFFHSVTLDKDKCLGCTNCIKRCPTEAIRVREGKAQIISERCIDCGECQRCDLDPDKICDNCMKCVMGDADYRAISITGIELEEES